jgi:type I restriction enzyme, R subunit
LRHSGSAIPLEGFAIAHFAHFRLNWHELTQPQSHQPLPESLTSRLIKRRLKLAFLLLNSLHQHIATMTPNNALVLRRLQQVETFSKRDRWNTLSAEGLETVVEQLADLSNSTAQENRLAREFDLLCLKRHNSFKWLCDQVRDTLGSARQC